MLNKLNKIAEAYNRYMNHVARTRVREALLQSSDRMLEDAGFSRELIEQGVQAWPWRETTTKQQEKPLAFDKISELHAVADVTFDHGERLHKQRVTEKTSKQLEETHKKVA